MYRHTFAIYEQESVNIIYSIFSRLFDDDTIRQYQAYKGYGHFHWKLLRSNCGLIALGSDS